MPRCAIPRSACPPTSAARSPTSRRSTRTTGALRLGKTLTTPQRLVTGIENGVGKAGSHFSAARLFLHGTTVAINTILERSGAQCALLTTQGFRDIYEIGRVNRPESYNLFFEKHAPLIDRDLRFEIMERMDAQGTVLIPLDEEQVLTVARERGRSQGVQAIAILFLHSYRNPAHEQRAKAIVEQRISAALRHRLARAEPGIPRVRAHLDRRGQRLCRPARAALSHRDGSASRRRGLRRQLPDRAVDRRTVRRRTTRGTPASACWNPAPPPASSAPRRCAIRSALANAIAFDMGGTTAKAGVIYEGNVLMTGSALIGGYATGLPVQMPMIDIQEVGTGGGSIARVEVGNALRVGPESAGAAPGPVCYGLGGTEPTITDANLMLGRLGADRFLGGEMPLDLRRREEGADREDRRRRSASIRSRRPKASCASPPRRWPTWCAG